MKSQVVKRSVVVNGHKTSVSLEEPFWVELKSIARQNKTTISAMIAELDSNRHAGNLSSVIRVFVLKKVRASLDDAGPLSKALN